MQISEFFPFWKLFLLLFAAGFVLGTVFANLAYQNRGLKNRVLSLLLPPAESLKKEQQSTMAPAIVWG